MPRPMSRTPGAGAGESGSAAGLVQCVANQEGVTQNIQTVPALSPKIIRATLHKIQPVKDATVYVWLLCRDIWHRNQTNTVAPNPTSVFNQRLYVILGQCITSCYHFK